MLDSASGGACNLFSGADMALKYEVATLEEVPESLRGEYVEAGGKYRLSVDGIDDAKELKTALAKEREERKSASAKAAELAAEKAALEEQGLIESQKFKELAELKGQAALKASQELDALKRHIADKDRSEAALRVAGSLTRDTARMELLKEQVMKHTVHGADGVSFEIDGVKVTPEILQKTLTEKYAFLVDGSGAAGGGATGGKGGGAANGNMGGSRSEREAAIAAKYNLPRS